MTAISHRLRRCSLAGLLLTGAFLKSSAAAADPVSCTLDTDCSKGFTCQVVGMTACPAYACPREVDGAATCPTPPPCNPQTIKECMPGPCSTDSDCATGMVCYADSYQSCPAPAPAPLPSCPPNAACAVPVAIDAGACTTTTVKSCVPRYDLPCTIDSDCGDGFTCVPDTVTACSGSGVAGVASVSGSSTTGGGGATTPSSPPTSPTPLPAVDAGVVVPPSCTTTTLSTSSCQAKTIPCATASECPSTWTCVAQPQAISNVCVGPALPVDAGTTPPSCGAPPPAQMLCEPPYYNSGAGLSLTGGASGAGAVAPGASAGAGAPVAAGAGAANGSTTQGGASGAGSSPDAPTGAAVGCQVAAPGTGGGYSSLLALLGLGAVARLVRRRATS